MSDEQPKSTNPLKSLLASAIKDFQSPFARGDRSLALLVIANLVPLGGAIFGSWSVFNILFLFWLENVIIGIFNFMRMLTCGSNAAAGMKEGSLPLPVKVFMACFFLVHYGGFCAGHGVFVVAMFGGDSGGLSGALSSGPLAWVSLAALAFSHGYSFVRNYLIGGERHRASMPKLMMIPYGRIVVMHLTIIIGGALAMFTGHQGPTALAVLVIVKTVIDARSHIWAHAKMKAVPASRPSKA